MNRKGNVVAAIFVMVIIAIFLMGMYAMMRPFKEIENRMIKNDLENITETQCEGRGYWYGSECHELSQRAEEVASSVKKKWLISGIIFIVGLILWLIHASTRQDPKLTVR